MLGRRISIISLSLSLLLASGCPEPGDEGGDTWGTGETGETGDGDRQPPPPSDDGGGVEDGGDVRPPVDTGDDDGGDGDGDPGPVDHPDRCWDRSWQGEEFPVVIFDNTIGRNDDITGSCGLGPAPDFQLGFSAPWAGTYTFDTAGSSFDTVLIVQPGECGEPELACNDDFIGLDSKLSVYLEQYQLVTISVDGTGVFEEGPLQLTIDAVEPLDCGPQMIAPNLPKQIIGDTSAADDLLAGDCGGMGAPEQVYEFVAPGPGHYRFSTEGSAFDTVLYTLDDCDGAPLACSDDVNLEPHSELIVELAGGQHQLIVVDGHDANDLGAFVLSVEEL